MSKWIDSLPEPCDVSPWGKDRAAAALSDIADAMAWMGDDRLLALDDIRAAAAEVRAMRKNLPREDQGCDRGSKTPTGTGDMRYQLWVAVRNLWWADTFPAYGMGTSLRVAEAALRSAGEQLIRDGGA